MELDLVETQEGTFMIGWFDDDRELDGGLCLGELRPGDSEHTFISTKVRQEAFPDKSWRGSIQHGALIWFDRERARRALMYANKCRQDFLDMATWPEWALQARAAGWTPPQGWKPSQG